MFHRPLLAIAAAIAPFAAAAETPDDFATYTPQATAVRIDSSEAPIIDGDLSDSVWSKAIPIDKFYQVDPVQGAEPSQSTRAYILYDEKNLYVAVYCYDDQPSKLRRKLLERDPPLQDDDGVRIFLDTFDTHRDGYFFATNPNGVKNDALIENNSTFRDEWNTIWDVKAKVVADGWIAEFRIPFQSISFDKSAKDWGFQIVRIIRRNNEEVRWSNIDRTRNIIDLTNRGNLVGIHDVKSGIGLEAQLFVTGSGSYDWETDSVHKALNPSANIFYKVTPSLTGSLTFNTDFSDAPLDSRQVNTGRFSLFFPETRTFFLQDAAVFEFGGRVYQGDVNGMPFFSRRIGIVDGQPVKIVAGAKLSGQLGRTSIGAIAAQMDGVNGGSGELLSAVRISVPVFTESKAGFVFTHGDPAGGANNSVAGADFQYKNTRILPGTVYADFAYVESFDAGKKGRTGAVDAAYRGDRWNGTIRFRDLSANYNPRLGFANRTGIRQYHLDGWRAYHPNGALLRYAESGVFLSVVTGLDDITLDSAWGGWLFARDNDGDRVEGQFEQDYLNITEPFSIAGIVPVSIGKYNFSQYTVVARMTESRIFAVGSSIVWGGIYDGDYLDVGTDISLRPNKHFRLKVSHEYTKFSLPSGEIGIHTFTAGAVVPISAEMRINADIQYDNISQNFTFLGRFSWEPRPEDEVFVSLGHAALIDRNAIPGSFRSEATSFALRLGHTLRF
ncbi:MAG TPA: carbohydrate binding family 9 domain-containing protein [Parvularculaceae bacterium]|nr:carbohydrate binding family 9 domain-containing protein [Parvularculaceae bacterium]